MQLNSKEKDAGSCEGCAQGKQRRDSFLKKSQQKSELLEVIHSDVCGPMHVYSVGGSRYYVTFIDDYSRYTSVYFIKIKVKCYASSENLWLWLKIKLERR